MEKGGVSAGPVVRPGAISALLATLFRAPAERDVTSVEAFHAGQVVGRFELLREIGRGGFGVVYEARDRELRRTVAFKSVRVGGALDARQQRLLYEAEAAARLAHPNIVTLYDVGHCDDGPYLVLELLRGRTLGQRLNDGPLPVKDALRIAIEVARGLAHAHAQGVVHRDLTPGNVFLCDDEQVKILDFGMAHAFGRRKVDGGTPAYMAPEQLSDAPEDERTDVFALGVILHEMLAGELPFRDGSALLDERSAPEIVTDEWPALGRLVGSMLEKSPLRRPRDGGAVLAALTALERDRRDPGAAGVSPGAGRGGSPAPRPALPARREPRLPNRGRRVSAPPSHPSRTETLKIERAKGAERRGQGDVRAQHLAKRAIQRLKLAHIIAEGTPVDLAGKRFAELVKARTEGEVDITVCPAAQLGDERANIHGVQLGAIDMCFASAGAMSAFASEFQVLDLPYLFPSAPSSYTYLDGPKGQELLALLERNRVHGVGFLENGARCFTSRRPLRRPEDLRGQKIRVLESPVYMAIVRALGATPMPIPYPELPRALQQRVVDGQENPPVNVYSARMFLWQPYMVTDRHAYHAFVFCVNGDVWSGLSEEVRRVLEAAFTEVQDLQRALSGRVDGDFLRLLGEKGVEVHVPTQVEMKAWHQATAKVYDETRSFLGGSWVADALQFRRDWDAGRYAGEDASYAARFARIDVPVDAVLRNFS
ncbi:MAG TPA: DctP family TRAP transporter solute-binding subunit [Anaeromyxobacter sp.]|nr:DctP family TRAP transporter solute-binding subunit [Anaeromyxobacter sp.]